MKDKDALGLLWLCSRSLSPLCCSRLLRAACALCRHLHCRCHLLLLLQLRVLQLGGRLRRAHACAPNICCAHAAEVSPTGWPEQASGREQAERGHRRRKRNAPELGTLHRRQLVRAREMALHGRRRRRRRRIIQLVPVRQGACNRLKSCSQHAG